LLKLSGGGGGGGDDFDVDFLCLCYFPQKWRIK